MNIVAAPGLTADVESESRYALAALPMTATDADEEAERELAAASGEPGRAQAPEPPSVGRITD